MNLPEKFQIKVNNQEELDKILAAGYSWSSYYMTFINNIPLLPSYIIFGFWKNKELIYNDKPYQPEKYKEISLSEFLGDESPKTPAAYLYTEYSEEVWALAAKWIENTEYTVGRDEGQTGIILNTDNKVIWKSSLEYSDLGPTMGEKLEPLEFLAKIRDLPKKQKKIEINILPWPVVIEGESVRVGCQTTTLCELKEIVKTINEDRDASFNGYTLSPRRKMLYVYGEKSLPWEIWDKFVAELKNKEINLPMTLNS
jgi:hypothetical protein